jgi:hypothetical protein
LIILDRFEMLTMNTDGFVCLSHWSNLGLTKKGPLGSAPTEAKAATLSQKSRRTARAKRARRASKQVSELGFIDYDGALNVMLQNQPQVKT